MNREEFKARWESNDSGGGITFNDIANAAIAWGITPVPRIMPIDQIRYLVLKAANTNDADSYRVES